MNGSATDGIPSDFSLVKGGSFYYLLCRIGHVRPKIRTSSAFRAVVFPLVAWLPLLLFSLWKIDGTGPITDLPFVYDFSIHIRFLLALPILILAEDMVDPGLRVVLNRFIETDIITSSDAPLFWESVNDAKRKRDSAIPEAVLIALIMFISVANVMAIVEPGQFTWPVGLSTGVHDLAPDSLWYALIAAPIFQFYLFRWVWRIAIWSQLLWRISKLDLQLEGSHPDRLGGLSFVNFGQGRFAPLLFAASSVISSHIGVLIAFKSAALTDFQRLIPTFVIISMALFALPLAVFTPVLLRTKRRSLFEYGIWGQAYTQNFQQKWFAKPRKGPEPVLLGTPDIQSLADLITSFDTVARMSTLLPNRKLFAIFGVAALLPMAPLLLTIFPLTQILLTAVKFLL